MCQRTLIKLLISRIMGFLFTAQMQNSPMETKSVGVCVCVPSMRTKENESLWVFWIKYIYFSFSLAVANGN